jgi:hypothetical protein
MEMVGWDLAKALPNATILTSAAKGLPGEVLTVETHADDRAGWRRASAEAFRDINPDVVLGISASANGMIQHRKPGQVWVFQAHGTSSGEIMSKLRSRSPKAYVGALRNLYWGLTQDPIYRKYDAVVAVGDEVSRQLCQGPTRFITGKAEMHLIQNGIDDRLFAFSAAERARVRNHLKIAPEVTVYLSLSRLHVQKGVDLGLRAFAALRRPAAHYIVVGSGPQELELMRLAENLGLGDRIHFIGAIERSAAPAYLSAADALVFPTRRVEVGATLNVLEALAAGLQVIATGGLPYPHIPVVGTVPALAEAMSKANGQRTGVLPVEHRLSVAVERYLALFDHHLHRRHPPALAA